MNILDINEIIWYGDRLPNDSNNNRIYKLRFWCAIVNGSKAISYNMKTGSAYEWEMEKRIGKPRKYVRMVDGVPRITKPYKWPEE
jgi:hypothetical protein